MSTRLTNDIRNAIAKDALAHRFGDDLKALIDAKAEFGATVYEDIYKKADRQRMDDLPAGWLPETDHIAVTFGESYARVYFSGNTYGNILKASPYRRTDKRRVLAKDDRGCVKVYDAGHKLSQQYSALRNREDDLKASYDLASKQIAAALGAVTTVKRLIETWPEIAPFAEKYEGEKPQLPALPTEQLNKILDLPVAEAA